MNNIMLDIETVGTSVNSIVMQVAMVKFDREGNIGDTFSIRLDSRKQKELGLAYDEATVNWWKTTNITLFKQLLNENITSLEEGLQKISDFICYGDLIWCHATFDAPILGNLFKTLNKKIPWGYKNVRDIRTLTDLSNLDLNSYNWTAEKTHDALDDCKFQIKYCCDAFKKLKGK